jgi:hypothetical protein
MVLSQFVWVDELYRVTNGVWRAQPPSPRDPGHTGRTQNYDMLGGVRCIEERILAGFQLKYIPSKIAFLRALTRQFYRSNRERDQSFAVRPLSQL